MLKKKNYLILVPAETISRVAGRQLGLLAYKYRHSGSDKSSLKVCKIPIPYCTPISALLTKSTHWKIQVYLQSCLPIFPAHLQSTVGFGSIYMTSMKQNKNFGLEKMKIRYLISDCPFMLALFYNLGLSQNLKM